MNSNLSARLRELLKGTGAANPGASVRMLPPPSATSRKYVAEVLGGVWGDAADDPCIVIEREYPADSWYGSVRVADCGAVACGPRGVLGALLGMDADGMSAGPLLFVDLETTGLSGGAGTYVFLVGFGFLENGGAFHTRQFFLGGYEQEHELLHTVAALVESAGAIVSYNGRTFDVPVIETRFLFHRMPVPFADVPHLDMLPYARRLWRRRSSDDDAGPKGPADEEEGPADEDSGLPCERPASRGGASYVGRSFSPAADMLPVGHGFRDRAALRDGAAARAAHVFPVGQGFSPANMSCSLIALERAVLGIERTGDVPGYEIPSRYFHYVRTGDPRPLAPVFEHNRRDLLSLAALTARVTRMLEGGAGATRDSLECLALGRLFERLGRPALAIACYERAAEHGRIDVRAEALGHIARRLRRERRYTEAAAAWEGILELSASMSRADREAREALAIHHEHRSQDLAAARQFALWTLERESDPRRVEALRRRLWRLERKIAVQHEGRASSALSDG